MGTALTSNHKMPWQDRSAVKTVGVPAVAAPLDSLAAAFKRFDTDGNGFLDEAELKAAFAAAGQPASDETIKHSFSLLDSNGEAGRVVRRPLPGRRRMRRARGYLRDDHRAGPKVLRGVRRLRRVRARVRLMVSQRLRSVRRAALRMLRCSKMRAIQHVCGEQVCVGGPNVQAPLAWVTVNENVDRDRRLLCVICECALCAAGRRFDFCGNTMSMRLK